MDVDHEGYVSMWKYHNTKATKTLKKTPSQKILVKPVKESFIYLAGLSYFHITVYELCIGLSHSNLLRYHRIE